MSRNASYIIDPAPGLAFSPNEQTTFFTLPDRLHSQVRTLDEQVKRNYIDAIPGTLSLMESICAGCRPLSSDKIQDPGAKSD
ncbi:hypothetical protein [Methylocaldum sp.]|uniref:hypothetical protein n=1 Tax=Methylocaldum sp. TaxID=1969727 RepID=UPI002D7A1706|nr:hypothetical protein [Methylocaldum sp.]